MWQAPRFLGQWGKFPESSIPALHIPRKYSKSFLAEEFWELIENARGYAGHTEVLFSLGPLLEGRLFVYLEMAIPSAMAALSLHLPFLFQHLMASSHQHICVFAGGGGVVDAATTAPRDTQEVTECLCPQQPPLPVFSNWAGGSLHVSGPLPGVATLKTLLFCFKSG